MISSLRLRGALATLAFATGAATAPAHQLWIGANAYLLTYPGPRPGPVSAQAFVTFGHRLPVDDPLDDERFGGLYLISGDGRPVRLETEPTGYRTVRLSFGSAGARWLASVNRPIFSTQVKDAAGNVAFVRAPKDAAPAGAQVVDATQIHGFAKTLVVVRGQGGAAAGDPVVSRPLGHTLELVPLGNPAALAKGGTLPVQVLFRGRPYVEEPLEIVAEHVAGAYLGAPAKWTGETDRQGRVAVPLALAGPWQVLVTVIDPVPPELKAKADQIRYRATLTFEVPGATYSQ